MFSVPLFTFSLSVSKFVFILAQAFLLPRACFSSSCGWSNAINGSTKNTGALAVQFIQHQQVLVQEPVKQTQLTAPF